MWTNLLNVLLVFCSLILIFLVLIQRGKGGGLAGAFGGAGGSSAFGTKAGDVFTKVTMYVAGIWILISMFLVLLVNQGRTSAWVGGSGGSGSTTQKSSTGSKTKPSAPSSSTAPKGDAGDIESAPPGSVPPTAPPSQPLNPGDPLAPIPDPLPTPPKGS